MATNGLITTFFHKREWVPEVTFHRCSILNSCPEKFRKCHRKTRTTEPFNQKGLYHSSFLWIILKFPVLFFTERLWATISLHVQSLQENHHTRVLNLFRVEWKDTRPPLFASERLFFVTLNQYQALSYSRSLLKTCLFLRVN